MKTHLKTTLPSNGVWRQKEKLQPFIWNKEFATAEPLTLYIFCLLVAIFIIILKPKSWCSFQQTHTCTTPKKSPYNVCFLSLTKSHALLQRSFPLGWTGEQELTIPRYPVKGHIVPREKANLLHGPTPSRPGKKGHLPRLWSHPSFTIATSFIMAGMSLGRSAYAKRSLLKFLSFSRSVHKAALVGFAVFLLLGYF